MIMRITWGKVEPGKWDEFVAKYRETTDPISGKFKGLRGRWLVHDHDDENAGFAVSIWDSLADFEAYQSSKEYEEGVHKPLMPYYVDDYRTYVCDVDVIENVG